MTSLLLTPRFDGQSPEACPITQLATWAAVQCAAASKARTHVVRRRHFNLCSRPKSPVTASPPPPPSQSVVSAAEETDGDNRFCISILPSFLSFYLSLSFAPSVREKCLRWPLRSTDIHQRGAAFRFGDCINMDPCVTCNPLTVLTSTH